MSYDVLAINTSTDMCSVALMLKSVIKENCIIKLHQHSRIILSMINNLLNNYNIELKNITFLVFSFGPGSFTGVRIGMGVAQGLSLGANLPLVGVSTLEVIAQGAWRKFGARRVLSVMHACLGKLYFAKYRRQVNGIWLCNEPAILISPNDLYNHVSLLQGSWFMAGTGWDIYSILDTMTCIQIVGKKKMLPSARDMLPLGLCEWNHGRVIDVNQVKPIYINNLFF